MRIKFEIITGEKHQVDALFSLLFRRDHKISHQLMPCYDDHKEFVEKNPYRAWFLLQISDDYIGSVYITNQNTIGINIMDDFIDDIIPIIIDEIKSTYEPLSAIKSVRASCFSINVAPSNTKLMSALKAYGCHIAQVSYVI